MKSILNISVLVVVTLFSVSTSAQSPIRASVDRDSILIGEEIKLKLTIAADTTSIVVIEKEKLQPFEIIERYKTDTTFIQRNRQLERSYGVSYYDSGSYTIPPLKVRIDTTLYATDSIRIYVNYPDMIEGQDMYANKEKIELLDTPLSGWWWLLLLIPILGGLLWFALSRKRKKEETEYDLPPYEFAMRRFKKLEQSDLASRGFYKEYYSELNYIFRYYMDKKIHVNALESTSTQLMGLLRSQEVVSVREVEFQHLPSIFNRSDMAKFAQAAPDVITMREDLEKTREFVQILHDRMPPPDEQELLWEEEYRKKKARKLLIKRIGWSAVAAGLLALAGLGAALYFNGVADTKDDLLGNESRDLYRGQWYTSAYGEPPVVMETPEILKRLKTEELPEKYSDILGKGQVFASGKLEDPVYVLFATRVFDQEIDSLVMNKSIEVVYQNLESLGAENITQRTEEFKLGKAEGLKVYGSFDYETGGDIIKKKYEIINLAEQGGYEQLSIIYDDEYKIEEDRKFANKTHERIVNSLRFPDPTELEKKKDDE